MRLVDVQIFPLGVNGWGSELLVFGENVTQLYGPNGCGKTPIVQSIAFCLGYPCVFRNDIYENCEYALLTIRKGESLLKIKRVFSRDPDIEVTDKNGDVQRFLSEGEYSLFLFDWMGMPEVNLVSNRNMKEKPYLATMLPIFYLDQDDGYRNIYCPPSSFIKDQFSEMMRMIFRIPVKNSYDAKKGRYESKERLDFLDRQVDSRKRELANARETLSVNKSKDELDEAIASLELELEKLKDAGLGHDESIAIYDRIIASHRSEMRLISDEISEINKRNSSITQIAQEINAEIETLTLNEEARRVFLSFDEICGAEKCKLFSSSSDSYSKNLLYLKDQIKDLERNSETDEVRLIDLRAELMRIERMISGVVDERNQVLERSEMASLVDIISKIRSNIFDLQLQKSDLEKIEGFERAYISVLADRDRALSDYESFTSSGSSIPEVVKLRADLRSALLDWLEKIQTKNISKDITFKDDFVPVLGKESVPQLKGSTRIRSVLAYHAAILELVAEIDFTNFRFLILDTPKQHEMHNVDLDGYVMALKELCANKNVQVIFSTTEYHYSGDEKDKEWIPKYPGLEQNMFLYTPNSKSIN